MVVVPRKPVWGAPGLVYYSSEKLRGGYLFIGSEIWAPKLNDREEQSSVGGFVI